MKKYDYANYMYDKQFNTDPEIQIMKKYKSGKKPPVQREKRVSQDGKGVQKGESVGNQRVGDRTIKNRNALDSYINRVKQARDRMSTEQLQKLNDLDRKRRYQRNSRKARGVYMENLATDEEYDRWIEKQGYGKK